MGYGLIFNVLNLVVSKYFEPERCRVVKNFFGSRSYFPLCDKKHSNYVKSWLADIFMTRGACGLEIAQGEISHKLYWCRVAYRASVLMKCKLFINISLFDKSVNGLIYSSDIKAYWPLLDKLLTNNTKMIIFLFGVRQNILWN